MQHVPFVDAHVHLWDLGRIHYPWLTAPFDDGGPNGSVAAIARDYGVADYLADAAGWTVRGIVHVDAGAEPAAALAETEWLEELAAAHGLPSGIVAFAALDDPDVGALLAAHARHGRVRGIRHIVNWHADPRRSYTSTDLTRDPAWARGFAALAGHGLSFDLQCYPGQMPQVAAIAARHPDVPVAINHAGMPVRSDPDGAGDWLAGMTALARLPQVRVKISGMGFVDRRWTPATVRDLVRRTIDLFGPGRCMIASDFPTDKLFGGFDETLGFYADVIAPLSDGERRAMWGGNANAFYRFGLDLEDAPR